MTEHHNPLRALAQRIQETDPEPYGQLKRAVKVLGIEAVQATIDEAEQIEQSGGMLTNDGTRRRTVGGIVFALLRQKVPSKDRYFVFRPPVQPATTALKQPTAPTLVWQDRQAIYGGIKAAPAKNMKGIVKGKPMRWAELPTATLCMFSLPTDDRTVPRVHPPQPLITPVSVYVGRKQWRSCADHVARGGNVLLEGVVCYDAGFEGIVLYATKVVILDRDVKSSLTVHLTMPVTESHCYDQQTIIRASYQPHASNLPKGMPDLPQNATDSVVLVSARQWNKLEAKPNDQVLIEGVGYHDPMWTGLCIATRTISTLRTLVDERGVCERQVNGTEGC